MLIYDGNCSFCHRCAGWLQTRGNVPMASDDEVDRRALGLTTEETKATVWWVKGEIRLRGHQAIGQALQTIGGGWALVGMFLRIPPGSWLGAIVYRWVAAKRHRFR